MEMKAMIKKIAWNTFKNTGDINTFLEYKQIENIENEIKDIQKNTNINVESIENKDNNKIINNQDHNQIQKL